MPKTSVIIVAAGKGLRMGVDTPKQFLSLSDVPILMRTLDKFNEALTQARLFVVLSAEMVEYWKELCSKHNFTVPHTVVEGGVTRFESVRNAVKWLPEDCEVVLVHDGVRPFVTHELIRRVEKEAVLYRSVVPCVEVVDSLREVVCESSVHVDRSRYRLVQTPQGFDAELFKRAYQQPYMDRFTDDASVVEALGVEAILTNGDRNNIKITTLSDMEFGEFITIYRQE